MDIVCGPVCLDIRSHAWLRSGLDCSATRGFSPAAHNRRWEVGLIRVLVSCDDDNIGSFRAIEKNGGAVENIVSGADLDRPKRRYWIDCLAELQP
jgi:hypothetical protein